MSAEKTYVDPSALRRLYVHDSHSKRFCDWRRRVGGSLPLTLHGKAEVINSICLAAFRHDISEEAAAQALSDLQDDLTEARLFVADVPWRRTLEKAAELSALHTSKLGTRTLDVLHVASAIVLGCRTFVTYDSRQANLGKAVGLRLRAP